MVDENNFDYLTIRGSGHMVPEFKPAATKSFLQHWLANKDWPGYVAPPSAARDQRSEL